VLLLIKSLIDNDEDDVNCGFMCVVGSAQIGEEKKVEKSVHGGGHSGSAVVIAATMSAIVVFVTAGIVALVVRQVQRHRRGKQAHRSVIIGQVSAPGLERVRSGCSNGPAN